MASRCRQLTVCRCPALLMHNVFPLHRRVSTRFVGNAAGSTSSTANSYINLGKFETMGSDVGRGATGIAYLEDTIKLQEAEYGAEVDPIRRSVRGMGLAKNLLEVGRQHHQLGSAAEAIEIYQRALGLFDDAIVLREDDESEKTQKALTFARFSKSEVLSSLGVAYNDSGQVEEALDMHQKSMELRKAIVGKEHPAIAECLNNLAGIYFGRGSHQRAAEHYEQAFELLIKASAIDSPYAALTLYNLGLCRAHLGQGPAAATALKRALQIAEKTLGADHRQVELIRETLKQGQTPTSQDASVEKPADS